MVKNHEVGNLRFHLVSADFLVLGELMISKKALEEFKKIYKAEFGEELSASEAMEKSTRFLNLMKVIMRPIPNEVDEVSNKSLRYEVTR